MIRGIVMFWGVVLCCGCGGPLYNGARVDLQYQGTAAVAVVTHDQRQEVLSGEREPSFIGISRGMVGEPWEVHTDGERPLAAEMSQAICLSLNQRGFNASRVVVPHSESPEAVAKSLRSKGASRMVLMTIHQWGYDGHFSTGISFHLQLKVLGRDGVVLASVGQSGEETLNQSSVAFFQTKLALLLNDPQVVATMGAKE